MDSDYNQIKFPCSLKDEEQNILTRELNSEDYLYESEIKTDIEWLLILLEGLEKLHCCGATMSTCNKIKTQIHARIESLNKLMDDEKYQAVLKTLKKDRDPREAKTSRKSNWWAPASVLGDTDFFRMDRSKWSKLVFLDSWEDDGVLSRYFNEMEKKCLENVFRFLFNNKGVENLALSDNYWEISRSTNSEEWWPTDWISEDKSPSKIKNVPHGPFTIAWSENKEAWFLVYPQEFKDDLCFTLILSVLEKGEAFKLIYDNYRRELREFREFLESVINEPEASGLEPFKPGIHGPEWHLYEEWGERGREKPHKNPYLKKSAAWDVLEGLKRARP